MCELVVLWSLEEACLVLVVLLPLLSFLSFRLYTFSPPSYLCIPSPFLFLSNLPSFLLPSTLFFPLASPSYVPSPLAFHLSSLYPCSPNPPVDSSYCPGGPDSDFEYSTQSYTGYEPTSMRAIRARYNPYLQAKHRLEQVHMCISKEQ